MPAMGAQVIDDLAPADLAQPGEDGRLAPEMRELAHRFAQGGLHHFARRFRVSAQPGQREAVQTGEVAVEEGIEGPLVAGEHALDELGFVGQGRIQKSPRIFVGRRWRHKPIG